MSNSSKKEIDLHEFQYKPLRFLFFVSKQKYWFGILAVLFVVVAGIFQAGIYPLVRNITNTLTGFNGNIGEVYLLFALFIIVLFFKNVFYRSSGFFAAKWISFMEMYSAQISFDYLLKHSAGYFANRLSGKLQNKVFNIANAVLDIFPILLWNFLTLIVKFVVLLFFSFSLNLTVGYVSLLFIVISVLYSLGVSQKMSAYSKEKSEKSSEVKGIMVDILGNILATKQNTAIKRELKNAQKTLLEHKELSVRNWLFMDTVLLFSNIIVIIMIAVVVWVSLHFWQQGSINVGELIMIVTLLLLIYGDIEFLGFSFNGFMEQYGKLKEGLEDVFESYEIMDNEDAKKVDIKDGEIVFDRVNFHYKEDEESSVFENLSLTIPKGQKIGLVGESGAGKSTFVNLLLRFMDVESGKIKIDGHNIQEIRQDDLRRSIAYVPQEALLFHRSLEENIKYSYDKASNDDMVQASKRAHALEFISGFPKQFKTLVGERGVKLSGGQKQRVMIARAMLKKSPILVLDEATSSLDSKAEKLIQEALEELMKNRTTIAIAHRLSTLKKMDRIVVFDDGKIVEDGTHKELLSKQGKYYELWKHQVG